MLPPVPMLPARVKELVVVLPPMVSVLKLAVSPAVRVTAAPAVPRLIVTSSLSVGTTPPLQFVPVSQVPVVPPAQVTLAAEATVVANKKANGRSKIEDNFTLGKHSFLNVI